MFLTIMQIPDDMPPGYGSGLNLIMWAVVILLLFMMLPLGLNAARKQEFEHLRKAEIARGAFGFFYGMARMFFMFGHNLNNGKNFDFWVILGYVFSMIGLSWLIFTYEYYKLGRKAPFFTSLGLVAAFISLTGFDDLIPGFRNVPRENILGIISGTATVLISLIAYVYFKTMERFPGKLRTRTFYEFIGLVIMLLGIIFDGQLFITQEGSPMFYRLYLPAVMAVVGVILINLAHDGKRWMFRSFALLGIILVFGLFVAHVHELR